MGLSLDFFNRQKKNRLAFSVVTINAEKLCPKLLWAKPQKTFLVQAN